MGDETLREALESAVDASNTDEGGTQRETPPVRSEERTEAAQPADAVRTPTGDKAAPARDAAGRFAPKTEAQAPANGKAAPVSTKPDGAAAPATARDPGARPAADQSQPTQRDLYAKAPQSWKPGAREAWANVPESIREEVHRREREVQRAAQEHATARNVATYVQRLQQQFAPALQAEGVDALTASANLMQLSSRLRFGTPVEKAQLAAHIVRHYGVDVVALAAALDGAEAREGPARPSQQGGMYQDPRVDQLLAQLQGVQQQREASLLATAESNVETFGSDPKHEFFEDVREDMGDLMELAAKRGVDMTMEQAYERACLMNPDIAKVLAAREAAGRTGTSQQTIQRAKAAASSVRGTPAPGVSTPPPTDLRSSIEAAIETVAGR